MATSVFLYSSSRASERCIFSLGIPFEVAVGSMWPAPQSVRRPPPRTTRFSRSVKKTSIAFLIGQWIDRNGPFHFADFFSSNFFPSLTFRSFRRGMWQHPSSVVRPSLLRQFALIVSCLRAIAAAVVRSAISLSLAFFEHPKINFLA